MMIKKVVLLLLFLPIYLFAWKMESGTVQLNKTGDDPNWVSVTFQQMYSDKPLVFTVPTKNGGQPVTFRIRNVTTSGFEILQVEPSGNNGPHAAMKAHYVAIDRGEHYLSDGTRLVASSFQTKIQQAASNVGVTTGWNSVTIGTAFPSTPVVLGMIQSADNEIGNIAEKPSVPWLTTAIRNVQSDSFEIALERSEVAVGDVNKSETIAYLAIEGNKQGSFIEALNKGLVQYETIVTDQTIKGWDDGCGSYNFVNTYTSAPQVIGTKQTRNESDGGWLRECNNTSKTSVSLAIDEDQYNDSERNHESETGGLVVFEKDFIFDSSSNAPLVEYRMDECYWFDNANGVAGDVKDESSSGFDATSYNSAAITTNSINPPVCNYGTFSADQDQVSTDDTTAGNTNGGAMSIAFWVKLDEQMGKWAVILTKSKSFNWNDGWGFVNPSGSAGDTLRFYMNRYGGTNVETTLTVGEGWVHIVGVYDGSSLILYKNGAQVGSSSNNNGITDSNDPMRVAFDDTRDATLQGSVDEVKFWNQPLSAAEIDIIYQNEKNGKNYDGTPRICPTCNATIAANSWELVGIPIDLRTDPKTVTETFQGMGGTYDTEWRVYRRDYSDTNNSSWYTYLDDPDNNMIEFGKAYWLGSKQQSTQTWTVDGTQAIDYNSTNPACTANRCVEIDLKSVTHNFDEDGDDGTGPYRYNMTGFVGKSPVDWADCRFIINGTTYTPSEAENAGYVSKQIWQYNPGDGSADSKGYTTCDDVTPGGCKLEPYKGFWVELHGPTKGKSVKLLIPKE